MFISYFKSTPEFLRFSGESFFRLWIECWIDNLTINKYFNKWFHLKGFDIFHFFVFFLNVIQNTLTNLINNIINMCTTSDCIDWIYKWYLLKLSIWWWNQYFPSIWFSLWKICKFSNIVQWSIFLKIVNRQLSLI